MTTLYVNPKLPNRVIAVTKGSDRIIVLRRIDPITLVDVDWGVGVEVYIVIDTGKTLVKVSGDVAGPLATIRMESDVVDAVRNGMMWQAIMSQPGTPTIETAVMVGTFERNDGR